MTQPPTPVWFVTGASKGMGLQIAARALQSGAQVVATSRQPEKLTEQLPSADLLAVAMPFTEEGVDQAVQAAVERFGRIDVVVNNAGYALLGAVEEFSADEVRANFDVNVFGLLTVIQRVLPIMRAQGSGHIVNMASISANVTGPATGLYSATKAAVLMLTEALAAEVAPFGVHATAVCPGGVRTDFLDPSSSRHAERRIDAYAGVQQTLAQYAQLNHRQGGDPARVADAIVELVALPDPPRRLYLGSDALGAIAHESAAVMESVREHRGLSESIDG